MRPPTKAQIRQLRRDNEAWPIALREIPKEQWPVKITSYNSSLEFSRLAVYRSRCFLAQLFDAPGDVLRLSVCRTDWDINKGSWCEAISWDELQRLKAEAGYADRWAVEVFPADGHVVNVANLRHIWLLPSAPPFAWLAQERPPTPPTDQEEEPIDGDEP